ncbi:hypothetical protein QYF61_023909 [Mycteria americana]|uniref:Uncharacterized protein n=1 Tax=Mycteria americana TaxID=33587 RepID=A0AAN7PTJ2_MYCAM|nr:hypothetical protein QYF61_023909 [Mycteria americana]
MWGDPDENSSEDTKERDVPPERHMGSRCGNPRASVRTTPWMGPKLSELQTRFSHRPGETEIEYLWRVSLMGGDWTLLSDDEVRGFWGPGVFLSDRLAGNQSVMSQVAYWAGGVDPKERGKPFTITVKGLSELAEGVQKAACVQAMYERGQHGVLLAALVDPSHLRPLIRGLLDAFRNTCSVSQRTDPEGHRTQSAKPSESTHTRADLGGDITWYSYSRV